MSIAGLSLVLALQALIEARPELTGITLRVEGSVIVVDSLDPGSRGGGNSEIQPGMVVHEIDNTPIDDIPVYTLDRYLEGYFVELGLANPGGGTTQRYFPPEAGPGPTFAFVVGVALLFGIASWVRRGHAGEALRPLALPLATASATSLILLPAWSILTWPTAIIGIVLAAVALLLLADGFVERVPGTARRRAAAASRRRHRCCLRGHVDRRSHPTIALDRDTRDRLATGGHRATRRRDHTRAGDPPGDGKGRSSDRVPILLAALTPWVIATTYEFTYLGYGLNLPLIWLLVVVFVLQTRERRRCAPSAPAGELGRQAHVLALLADGEGELAVLDHHSITFSSSSTTGRAARGPGRAPWSRTAPDPRTTRRCRSSRRAARG